MLATIAVKSQFLGANREINIGHHRCTSSIPDALLSCRRCNPILPFDSKRSRLPNPAVRGGMATAVGATVSKVRIARHSGCIPKKLLPEFCKAASCPRAPMRWRLRSVESVRYCTMHQLPHRNDPGPCSRPRDATTVV